MAASWFLEKEKEEGRHQAIIFGLLAGLLLTAAWATEALVPFEGCGRSCGSLPRWFTAASPMRFWPRVLAGTTARPRTMRQHDGGGLLGPGASAVGIENLQQAWFRPRLCEKSSFSEN
jgi:hypothetical protein